MHLSVGMCPHLKGSKKGTLCGINNNPIGNMEAFTIELCMSRRHEACYLYMRSLQSMVECSLHIGQRK